MMKISRAGSVVESVCKQVIRYQVKTVTAFYKTKKLESLQKVALYECLHQNAATTFKKFLMYWLVFEKSIIINALTVMYKLILTDSWFLVPKFSKHFMNAH